MEILFFIIFLRGIGPKENKHNGKWIFSSLLNINELKINVIIFGKIKMKFIMTRSFFRILLMKI
jgi:hypothetical protein